MSRYGVGDRVTILPPYNDDPVIIEHQHYAVVVATHPDGYIIALSSTFPPNERFGPFPETRLAKGWTP